MKKLVLAYSGGLDTSYCALYLSKEKNMEVHAVSVNTGGFSSKEVKEMEKKATNLGIHTYKNIEATSIFYEKVIKFLIFGNVLKNNTYPLSVSAERIVQAIEIVNYAKKIGANYIAHGSTGAGNDQVRFDMIFQILAPDIKIITPIRDNNLYRKEEIDYLTSKGIKMSWKKSQYSINKGLWGTSVGGSETLTSNLPLPEEAFPSALKKSNTKKVILNFEKGELIAVNNQKDSPINNIIKLNKIASKYAIGRDIHTGDTILGIKGRVGFEASSAIITIKAHHLLEKHTLSKWQLQHKDYMANWYGMHLHEGLYLDPIMRNIEAFLADSQANVTGTVYLTLRPYTFSLDGIESKYDLMNSDFGDYGEDNKNWTAEEVKGFIKIYANQGKIYHKTHTL